MNFSVIRTPEQLRAHRHCWDEMDVRTPFQSFSWVNSYARQLGELSELCFLFASDHDHRWLGFIPMSLEEGIQRTLRPFPSFPSNGNEPNPLCGVSRKGNSGAFANGLVRLLADVKTAQGLLGPFDAVVIDQIHRFSPQIDRQLQPMQQAGYRTRFQETANHWTYLLPSTYQAFEESLPEDIAFRASYLLDFIDEQIDTESTKSHSFQKLWNEFKGLRVAVEPELEDLFANDQQTFWLGNALQELAETGDVEIRINYLATSPISGVILVNSGNDEQMIYQSAISPFATLSGVHEWTVLEAIRHSIRSGFRRLTMKEGVIDACASWNAEVTPKFQAKWVAPNLSSRIKDSIISSGQAFFSSVFSPN